jgi:hypothetical protein
MAAQVDQASPPMVVVEAGWPPPAPLELAEMETVAMAGQAVSVPPTVGATRYMAVAVVETVAAPQAAVLGVALAGAVAVAAARIMEQQSALAGYRPMEARGRQRTRPLVLPGLRRLAGAAG